MTCEHPHWEPKRHRHVSNVGGIYVVDVTRCVPTCVNCGQVEIALEELGEFERRAADFVLQSVATPTAGQISYARRASDPDAVADGAQAPLLSYVAKVTQEDGSWLAEFPDAPGCQTCDDSFEGLIAMAQEALEGWLEASLMDGLKPPMPICSPVVGDLCLLLPGDLARSLCGKQ